MTDQPRFLYGVELKPRMMIAPKYTIDMSTPEGREDILRAARKVIAEHRDTLMALKDR